jgi:hypothetical protein
MSYHPTVGGKLREGDFRSRQVTGCMVLGGSDPVKEIGQTCGLNVIMRRPAPQPVHVLHSIGKLNVPSRLFLWWRFVALGVPSTRVPLRRKVSIQPSLS